MAMASARHGTFLTAALKAPCTLHTSCPTSICLHFWHGCLPLDAEAPCVVHNALAHPGYGLGACGKLETPPIKSSTKPSLMMLRMMPSSEAIFLASFTMAVVFISLQGVNTLYN